MTRQDHVPHDHAPFHHASVIKCRLTRNFHHPANRSLRHLKVIRSLRVTARNIRIHEFEIRKKYIHRALKAAHGLLGLVRTRIIHDRDSKTPLSGYPHRADNLRYEVGGGDQVDIICMLPLKIEKGLRQLLLRHRDTDDLITGSAACRRFEERLSCRCFGERPSCQCFGERPSCRRICRDWTSG